MVTRLEVVNAYGALLEREPESDAAIEHHLHFSSFPDLCAAIISSEEFQNRFARKFGIGPLDQELFGRRESQAAKITIGELDDVARAFEANDKRPWLGRTLELPDWYDHSIDPASRAYRDQILRLWSAITGRSNYDPKTHEDTPEIAALDAFHRPAFFASKDSSFAGGQMMAMGHILLRSGVGEGSRVLEYGAGFGQTAAAFARLGATVDTVDINPAFCGVVRTVAAKYEVDLRPHIGIFGHNPAGEDGAYDLIYFYEAFHHSLDFRALVPALKRMLKPGGKVILAGEPIFDGPCDEMPYPWGFRLDWENVAVMRIRGWMELGFQKGYLLDQFAAAGFNCIIHTDPNSHWAQVYEFRQR